jgi:glutamyl-tRNA(Gln) amidotransferase subunit E
MDYKKLGLKVGLEFHQRLDTKKLFCNCEEKEDPQFLEAKRKLRPVAGELGEIDPAALYEFLKGRTFAYRSPHASSCLVELDEEPPHALNPEALDIALEIALLLNCEIVDEVHVMRKTVIDGSNTSGFQRTALVGVGGCATEGKARVEIPEVYLEEESAGIVEKKDGEATYELTRLGIPLVEIKTGIMELEPSQVGELARKIGTLLRVTGLVKRGIGTIRQDVNVSIRDGARVEVKGCQELRLIPRTIENEVSRQLGLLEVRDRIKGLKTPSEIYDFSAYFKGTQNRRISAALAERGRVLGIALKGFAGLIGKELYPGRRFGTELEIGRAHV